ncbi:hypothetical protein AMJ49_07245 [Parcubacteria bacterium DG_74_2]|nr:MAG: hypothetical protein AMJ49_07245 [Parcubacteria bacterium DG_74_2]
MGLDDEEEEWLCNIGDFQEEHVETESVKLLYDLHTLGLIGFYSHRLMKDCSVPYLTPEGVKLVEEIKKKRKKEKEKVKEWEL